MSEKIIETRICKISGKSFDITEEDAAFYNKISPVIGWENFPIPFPTLCPEERLRRRLAWRAMYNLYRSRCALTGKDIISVYPPNKSYKPTDQATWWSDKVENLDTGRKYDFTRSFTSQYDELIKDTPLPCLSNDYTTNENSDFVQWTNYVKDCYLVFNAANDENCEYSDSIYSSEDTFDSYFVRGCSNCYDWIGISRCHDSISLEESEDCTRVDFSYNMKWCNDCILSYGQNNKSYMIGNKQYTKETYETELRKYKKPNGSYDYKFLSDIFTKMKSEELIEKVIIYNSENVSGNHLSNCFNVHSSTDVVDSKNCKYINTIGKWEDVYDCFSWWYTIENAYESMAIGTNASNIIGCYAVWSGTSRMYYSFSCIGCTDCFGCVWLRNKQYCVMNKQYSKEEYETLVRKIIKNMIRDGEWWEYPSPSISLWGYNETMANMYFPETKETIIQKWYTWNDYMPPVPEAMKYIPASKLPDDILSVPDDILSWAIECEISKKYFKITKQELDFYRKNILPLPRKHPNIRRSERFERRF